MASLQYHATAAALMILTCAGVAVAEPSEPIRFSPTIGRVDEMGFGKTLAIDHTTLLVAALYDGRGPQNAGLVYVYDIEGPRQKRILRASDAGSNDYFGNSLGISGSTAVIGAPFADAPYYNSGSAYLFDVSTGEELFKLSPPVPGSLNGFGSAVAIDGDTVIVTATGYDAPGVDYAGAVYVYNALNGQFVRQIMASQPSSDDAFGRTAALHNNLALIGAPHDDELGENTGSAYVFDVTSGAQLLKLTASDAAPLAFLGQSVALNDQYAVVGASGYDGVANDTGAAYVFDVHTGQQLYKLTGSTVGENDNFGASVAISGRYALVGTSDDAGSAYLFDLLTGNELCELVPWQTSQSLYVNAKVAFNGESAVIGAPTYGTFNRGEAFLFEYVPEPSTALLSTIFLPWLLRHRQH